VHFFLPNWIQVKYHIEAIIPSFLFPDLGASIYVQYDNCRYTYASPNSPIPEVNKSSAIGIKILE
jgi:hypothetical protein